jgi:hypothetical protein
MIATQMSKANPFRIRFMFSSFVVGSESKDKKEGEKFQEVKQKRRGNR